jgi:glycosyltransferase involved in cell wall biosynthesis
VLTLHDLIFERERTLGPVSTLARRVLVRWAAGGAAAIITGTESARREIQRDLRLRSDAITVIHHGPGRDPVSPKPVPHALVDRPFILSVGALRPHKSQVVMVRALAHLPDDIHLVVCGYEERYATTIATEAASLGLAARVHLLGYVDDGVLEALWGAASCAASASRAEGFGLTLLEAMRRGVPSVCSDLEVTREVGGDAAYYFAVDDPADAARAVRAAMEDPRAGERGRARASMFSWAAAAAKTWEVYDRVARAAM